MLAARSPDRAITHGEHAGNNRLESAADAMKSSFKVDSRGWKIDLGTDNFLC